MNSPAFGDINYESPSSPSGRNGSPESAPTGAAPEIDINDPRLTSEVLEFDPKGDAFARPPVLPDGFHRAKLKQRDTDPDKGRRYRAGLGRDKHAYLYTFVDAQIIDLASGKWDGIIITDNFVSTMVNRDGSMKIATIMDRALGKTMAKAAPAILMKAFIDALAAEPEAGVETAWEWSCQHCNEEAEKAGRRRPRAIQGMHNFPQVHTKDTNGKPALAYNPDLKCSADPRHGISVARPRIVRYLSLAELQKLQAATTGLKQTA